MFYLCTVLQGFPEKGKLVQLKKDSLEELKKYVFGDDDICWIEDENKNVVYGKSKIKE